MQDAGFKIFGCTLNTEAERRSEAPPRSILDSTVDLQETPRIEGLGFTG